MSSGRKTWRPARSHAAFRARHEVPDFQVRASPSATPQAATVRPLRIVAETG
jgi:hypothetical protein